MQKLGSSVHTTYSKLSYKPAWGLIEKVDTRARRLSKRGIDFMQGLLTIPNAVEKDPITGEWTATKNATEVSAGDL